MLQHSTFAAIPRVLGELCAGNACQGITANPTATLSSLVKRLARRPLRARYVDSRGRAHRITITRQDLLTMLLNGDTNPALRAEVPAALGSLRRGDRGPLARLIAHAGGQVTLAAARRVGRPRALRGDDVRGALLPLEPRARTGGRGRGRPRGVVADTPPANFAPFDRETALGSELLGLCLRWPVASAAPAPIGPLPAVPTLMLSGGADLRTPTEDARATAARLPLGAADRRGPLGRALGAEQRAVRAGVRGARARRVLRRRSRSRAARRRSAPISARPPPAAAPRGRPDRRDATRASGQDRERGARHRHRPAAPGPLRGLRGRRAPASCRDRCAAASPACARRACACATRATSAGRARLRAGRRRTAPSSLRIRGGGALRGTVTVSADLQRISGRLGGRRFSIVRSSAAARPERLPTVAEALRASALRDAG